MTDREGAAQEGPRAELEPLRDELGSRLDGEKCLGLSLS